MLCILFNFFLTLSYFFIYNLVSEPHLWPFQTSIMEFYGKIVYALVNGCHRELFLQNACQGPKYLSLPPWRRSL